MFVSHLKEDAKFIYNFYKYTKNKYAKDFNCFYERINSFFLVEFLFAFVVRLDINIIDEVAEYNYKKYLLKNKNKFYTKILFRFLAKIYFIKYYTKLNKKKISHLFIWDDNEIKKRALILAAKILKINYKIFYKSYNDNLILIEDFATRHKSLISRNYEFYLNFEYERKKYEIEKKDIVLVYLQDDNSVDCILYAPIISKQKDFIKLIYNISQKLKNTKFIIFNAEFKNFVSENIIYAKEKFEDFLPYAKAVVTINSADVLKCLDYETPIITFGDAFYNIEGVSTTPTSEEGLVDAIDNPENYYNQKVAGAFMNYIDGKSIEIASMESPSNNVFEEILSS